MRVMRASNGVSALGYSGVAPWLPGRQSHSLQYISPNFSGVTAQIGFQPKGNRDKNVFSAGVKYAAGPFAVAGSFQTKSVSGGENFASVAGSSGDSPLKTNPLTGKVCSAGVGPPMLLGSSLPMAMANNFWSA